MTNASYRRLWAIVRIGFSTLPAGRNIVRRARRRPRGYFAALGSRLPGSESVLEAAGGF